MILTVVEKQLRSHSLNWRRQKVFSFNSVSRTAKASIEVAGLAFLTFHISHRSKDWAGIHCAIATRVDADGIHLLDSLGRRDRKSPNATILAKKGDKGWPVRGAPTIVTEKSVRFLEGLPSVAGHLK
jgi:hypothetical protein